MYSRVLEQIMEIDGEFFPYPENTFEEELCLTETDFCQTYWIQKLYFPPIPIFSIDSEYYISISGTI